MSIDEAEQRVGGDSRRSLLAEVVAAAPIGVAVARRQGDELLYFNDRFCTLWGLQPVAERMARRELRFSDVVAYCAMRAKRPADLAHRLQGLLRSDDDIADKDELELADGSTIGLLSHPIRDGAHSARFYIFEDITERLTAERGFAESERSLRTFIEGVEDYALYLLDLEGRVTSWNAGAEKLTRFTAAEILGHSFDRFLPPEEVETGVPHRALRTARQTGRFAYEGWHRRKDGSRFWAENVLNAIPDEAGRAIGFAAITRDGTGRKLAEEALRLNEARLRAIMDSTVDGIITIDQNGTIVTFSAPAERIFGYAAAEVVGRNVSLLMPEPYRSEHDAYVGSYLRTGVRKIIGIGREVEGLRKDGTAFPMDLAVGELPPEGGRRAFVGTVRDISERRALERQLQQAQKMEAVGQLTGGVAHDFNNLLAVVLGNLEIVQERLADGEARKLIDTALRATQRGSDLTQRLLAFSRRQMLRPELIDVNQLVRDMVELIDHTLGETIQVRMTLAADLWMARVDPAQLENALVNLAVNARDAMPRGGTLAIETGNIVLDASYAERSPDVPPGRYVLLAVSDTGTGMPPEVLLRVFEPFFTTKEMGKGSGLGLSMVYGFVKQSGGHVTIYSEPGHGTTVKIYLPRAASESGTAPPDPVEESAPRGRGEVVLVVEDDPDIRALAAFLLGELGYEVVTGEDGHKGLAVLVERPEIDLLLTDVVLPRGISGAALAERARLHHPDLPVVYMSGYAASTALAAGITDERARLINKPFRKSELARTVRQALDERRRS